MKSIFTIAIVGAVMLSSCSVYRDGQTPDDVYYSPAREVNNNAYVQTQSGRDEGRRYNDYSNSRSGYSAYDDFATMDDRWLMMRVRNPYRWSMFDDYSYFNTFSPYGIGYGYGMGGFYSPYNNFGWGGYNTGWSFGLGFGGYNPWGFGGGYGHFNNYYNWNNYYNPYYGGVVIVNPKSSNRAYFNRNFNLNNYSNSNVNSRGGVSNGRPQFNNTNRIRYNNSNNSTLGGSNRRYSNGNNDYYRQPSSSGDRPSRSYSPSYNNNNSPSYSPSSSGSSGSSGGGNSGGGGGSRPSRR